MIKEDGTTTWEERRDLAPGILNKTWGWRDSETGITYQAQGLYTPLDPKIPEDAYFVFWGPDLFLPGFWEKPFDRVFWDDSVPPRGKNRRGVRLIYDIVIKVLGNDGQAAGGLKRRSGYPKNLLERRFRVAIDDPKLPDYLNLCLDLERGINRLPPFSGTRVLRDLTFECQASKRTIVMRNPDYLPEYDKLEEKDPLAIG
jgi:hypothetical protein